MTRTVNKSIPILCSACGGGGLSSTDVPLIGPVCDPCLERLGKPQVLDGCVGSESLLFIATEWAAEFERRTQTLLKTVAEACR